MNTFKNELLIYFDDLIKNRKNIHFQIDMDNPNFIKFYFDHAMHLSKVKLFELINKYPNEKEDFFKLYKEDYSWNISIIDFESYIVSFNYSKFYTCYTKFHTKNFRNFVNEFNINLTKRDIENISWFLNSLDEDEYKKYNDMINIPIEFY